MIQEKRRMFIGDRRVSRAEYPTIKRNPIKIISWSNDPVNIGGLIRNSEIFLVDKVYVKRRPHKTAVSADKWQPLEYDWDERRIISEAIDDGYTIVALEQTDESSFLHLVDLPYRMCLLIGNERFGVPDSVLALSQAVEIRQFGFISSLNLVCATSIALYEWAKQWAYNL